MAQEKFIYELLDIEWNLNYDFQNTPPRLMRDKEDSADAETEAGLPIEYDENGIPKGGSPDENRIRKQIIYDFYERWKAAHPELSVYNASLKEDILIRNESVLEAVGHAARNYLSTLAVLQLDQLLSNAVYVDWDQTKPNTANQKKLSKLLLLIYEFENIGRVKLTVGVRRSNDAKIQYGITSLKDGEVVEPIVRNAKNKKKAPHKK